MRVVVASRNRHKLREIGVLLADSGLAWDLVSVDEVAPKCALTEDEPSFEGNALSKARQAAAATALPALADDSGIEVDALAGAPGVYSARWSGEPNRVGSGRALLAAYHRGRGWEPSQGSHFNYSEKLPPASRPNHIRGAVPTSPIGSTVKEKWRAPSSA